MDSHHSVYREKHGCQQTIYIVQDLRHALDVVTTIPQLIIVHLVIN